MFALYSCFEYGLEFQIFMRFTVKLRQVLLNVLNLLLKKVRQ